MPVLSQILLYLLFALITVPIAKKCKLGSVLGYLIAGILIGPIFGLIGSEVSTVQHFAEFGVVMMMFLIGLELKPKEIWHMKYQLIGLGGCQILLSTFLLSVVLLFLFSFPWNQALTLALIFALSSTAIVLQSTREINQMNTKAGQSILSVLIAQDIAVIPIYAILPLLIYSSGSINSESERSFIGSLPGYIQAIIILLSIMTMILIGRFVLQHVFRYIAKTKLVELFTALVLVLVISVAIIMQSLGLSEALGAFIAGVILSDSAYRHEIESQISPFKGLLMGIFFISIGASINFSIFIQDWLFIVTLTFFLILGKVFVLMLLAKLYRLKKSDFWQFSLSLAQGGEFAFVLIGFSVTLSLISLSIAEISTLAVILSMLITPIFFLVYEKFILPHYQSVKNKDSDKINHDSSVIIAGAGRFGQVIARVLHANDYNPVILDSDINTVDTFLKYGGVAYYGDALNPELLISAGITDTRLFIAALDDRESQTKLIHLLRRHQKDLLIIARAVDRHHVYELEEAGANYIIRETFESASLAAIEALVMLGWTKESAKNKVDIFKIHDQQSLYELKEMWLNNGEDKNYISQAEKNRKILNELMKKDL
ncbi:MAG: cation:proton antiporter [Francisellaceae bacterium]